MKRRSLLKTTAALLLGTTTNTFARPVKGARCRVRRLNTQSAAETGPLVFDLTAEERWPIRGLDPVLYVGGVTVESYQFANAENTVLRFTCYDPSGIQNGGGMFLQYGDDVSTKTEFPNFSWNTVQ